MDSYYEMLKVTRESKFPEDVTKSYRRLSLRAPPARDQRLLFRSPARVAESR